MLAYFHTFIASGWKSFTILKKLDVFTRGGFEAIAGLSKLYTVDVFKHFN